MSTRGFSIDVNRPERDANYTLPETKLGLEVLYLRKVKGHGVNHYLLFILTAIPLQAWTGPEGSRRVKLPDFKTVGT